MRRIVGLAALGAVFLAGSAQTPPGRTSPLLLDTPYAPAGYERLLHRHLEIVPLPGGGHESRFDYAGFHARPDQGNVRAEIRERFLGVDPDEFDVATRRAWAVNAYNFLVLDVVIENWVRAGGDTLASIADLGEKAMAVFDEERYTIHGERYSLNRLEREFLFGNPGGAPGNAAGTLDPRFHFLLVCAAKGCPPLEQHPYEPARLDPQLVAAVRNALLSPRHLRREGKTVHVSKIFEWYEKDFSAEGVRAFLARYAPEPTAHALAGQKDAPEIATDIEWDWSLNRR